MNAQDPGGVNIPKHLDRPKDRDGSGRKSIALGCHIGENLFSTGIQKLYKGSKFLSTVLTVYTDHLPESQNRGKTGFTSGAPENFIMGPAYINFFVRTSIDETARLRGKGTVHLPVLHKVSSAEPMYSTHNALLSLEVAVNNWRSRVP